MTSTPSDKPTRVLFLGTPGSDDTDRWTELHTRLAAVHVETTHTLDGELDYAIVTEDILDGYCTAEEALALQKLRARGVAWVSTGADLDHIVETVTQTENGEVADSSRAGGTVTAAQTAV